MNKPVVSIGPLVWSLLFFLACFSMQAFAAVDNVGVLNKAHNKFEAAAEAWRIVIMQRATWLFWLLATISMVWTFGFMALRKADIGEFFAEFVRFTLFTGFYWWLLQNGPEYAIGIIKSMRQIGAEASGLPNDLGPSGIVDVGFDIFYKVIDQASIWQPVDALFGMFLAAVILVAFALVGTNMLLLLISAFIFSYAGIFILGFGGSKWTSDMAINYYKSVLNLALQLMTMVLLVGIGRSFLNDYHQAMSGGILLGEMGVMVVVAAVLLFLVAKLPPQIGALAGGTTGALGSNFGVGTAVAAAAMAGAAVASAGAALAGAAAGAAGGAQALMAAVSKASAAESGTSDGASAVGDSGSGSGGTDRNSGHDSVSNATDGNDKSSLASAMGDSDSVSQFSGSSESSGSPASSGSPPGSSAKGAHSSAKHSGAMEKARSAAANARKVATGAAANLAHGSWDAAKNNLSDRISNTMGGKIASAIKAKENSSGRDSYATSFERDSLSAGHDSADATSEIAAFRDRGSS